MSADDYVQEMALSEAQQQVLLQAIANKEGLQMTQEEIDAKMAEEMEKYEIETKEELLGTASEEQYANFYMCRKVLEFLAEKATITEVVPEQDLTGAPLANPVESGEETGAEASVEVEAAEGSEAAAE